MNQPTDEQIWKMLDAWYQLIGRRIAPTAAERDRDFAAMRQSLIEFEASISVSVSVGVAGEDLEAGDLVYRDASGRWHRTT